MADFLGSVVAVTESGGTLLHVVVVVVKYHRESRTDRERPDIALRHRRRCGAASPPP
jgi:hypothetical protein